MEFREGGSWIYAMIDPEGKEYWGRMDYLKIKPIDSYEALDGFCDENGDINKDLPRSNWEVTFSDVASNALVQTVVRYKSLSDLEAVLQMGIKEGLTSTLERLDDLLATLKK